MALKHDRASRMFLRLSRAGFVLQNIIIMDKFTVLIHGDPSVFDFSITIETSCTKSDVEVLPFSRWLANQFVGLLHSIDAAAILIVKVSF